MSGAQSLIADYLRTRQQQPTGANISSVLSSLATNPDLVPGLRAAEPISSYGDPGVAGPPTQPQPRRPVTAVTRGGSQQGSVGALNEVAQPPKLPSTPLSAALDKAVAPRAPQAPANATQPTPAPTPAPQITRPTAGVPSDVAPPMSVPSPNVAQGAVDDGGASAVQAAIDLFKPRPTPGIPTKPPTSYTGPPQPPTTAYPGITDTSAPEGSYYPSNAPNQIINREELRAINPDYGEGGFINGLVRAARDMYASRNSPEAMWNTLTAPGYFAKEDMETGAGIASALGGGVGAPALLRNIPGIARAIISNMPPPGSVPPNVQPPNMRSGTPQRNPWTEPSVGAGGRPNVTAPRRAPPGQSQMPPTGKPVNPFGQAESKTQQSPWENRPLGAPTQSVPRAQQSAPLPPDAVQESPIPPSAFSEANTSGAGGGAMPMPQQPITPNVVLGTGQTQGVPQYGPSPVQTTRPPPPNATPTPTDLSNIRLGTPTMPQPAPSTPIPPEYWLQQLIHGLPLDTPNVPSMPAPAPASPVPVPTSVPKTVDLTGPRPVDIRQGPPPVTAVNRGARKPEKPKTMSQVALERSRASSR